MRCDAIVRFSGEKCRVRRGGMCFTRDRRAHTQRKRDKKASDDEYKTPQRRTFQFNRWLVNQNGTDTQTLLLGSRQKKCEELKG